MTRRLAVLVLAILAPARAAAQEITVSPIDLLSYYEMGQHERVLKAVADASRGDLAVVLEAFKRDSAAWIAQDGPKWVERRRMIVATVALEVAHAAFDLQWTNSEALIEWTCALLRKERSVSPFERAWHLAALALLEGARDIEALQLHLTHMKARVPDEPRLLLARAFVAETYYWDDVMYPPFGGTTIPRPFRERQLWTEDAMAALVPVLAHPQARNEAAMRLGFYAWRAGRAAQALQYLSTIETPDDPGQAHLMHLFTAWSHERLERPDQAIAAFRKALEAVPGAQSASLYLAVRLHAAGRGQEARQIMDTSLEMDPAPVDPWRTFGYGDLRRWPVLIADLRRMVR